MLLMSIKPAHEIIGAGVRLLPRDPTIDNYTRVIRDTLIARFLLNGLVVVTLTLAGQILVSLPAAYAFAKRKFPLKQLLFGGVLAALVFPRYIAAIPNFLLVSRTGMLDTYAALVLPSLASPFCIFLLRQYILTIPEDYFDAARIEGCTITGTIARILVPMIRPALGSFAIFSIVVHWNDLFWPMIVVQHTEMLTPPAGIVFFADAEGLSDWGAIMAASVLVIAPLVAFFFSSTRQFINGMTHAGLKG